MGKEHLKIVDLWHKYGSSSSDNYTLKSINFSLRPGELVGLVGPSGCGKTTLLRLIAGFESPSKGQILLSGREISSARRILPPEKRGVGMVFQDYALFPHLDVWENVCFGLKPNFDSSRPRWLLELLELSSFSSRYPHELSGGQRQRLALARALAPSPSIVLLDEPFNSLDLHIRLKLRNELSSVLKSCSATALFVTHDSSEALAICDRIALVRNSELVQFDSPKELINNPSNSFVGEFIFQQNVLPISPVGNRFTSPIGTLNINKQINTKDFNTALFDSTSIEILNSNSPNAVIKAIEFCKDHFILTVKIQEFFLRVRTPLTQNYLLGDSCQVKFKADQNIILFPGTHKVSIA